MMQNNIAAEFEKSHAYIGMGSVLIKGDAADPSIVYIEASNEVEDSEGDTILRKALEEEAGKFLKRGVISYDHLHKIEKSPEYIIGEPLDVKFTDDNRTLVKARLYTGKNQHAQAIKAMADEGSTRLGASVGGAILGRKKMFDSNMKKSRNYIVKVLWDEVAITHKPVNEETLGGVSLLPYDAFKKSWMNNDVERVELMKALAAGGGTDAVAFTGGRALMSESLQGSGSLRNAEQDEKLRMQKVLKANAELMSAIVTNVLKARKAYTVEMLKSDMRQHGYDETYLRFVLPSATELVNYINNFTRSM
jgi:hypothetical protein